MRRFQTTVHLYYDVYKIAMLRVRHCFHFQMSCCKGRLRNRTLENQGQRGIVDFKAQDCLCSVGMNKTSTNPQPLQICDFYVKVETDVVETFTACIDLVFAVTAILGICKAPVLLTMRRTAALWLPTAF